MAPSSILASLGLLAGLTAGLSHRTACPEGYIQWPVDLTCHRPFSQGPCATDQHLVDHPQGPFCKNVLLDSVLVIRPPSAAAAGIRRNEELTLVAVAKDEISWPLPQNGTARLTAKEEACLEAKKMYWPADQACHDLLGQGPCARGEWLVLEAALGGEDRVVCRPRLCPCDPARPDLCEVEVAREEKEEERPGCRCRVAQAAAQDGLCEVGEQLYVSPYGVGVCGCITAPPHVIWSGDGHCYPLHARGPCQPGYQLSVPPPGSLSKLLSDNNTPAPATEAASCQPALCSDGSVLWPEDGACYPLGEPGGPCPDLHILTVDSTSLRPVCRLNKSKVRRVYDVIPGGFIRDAPILAEMKVTAANCWLDARGRCVRGGERAFRRGGGVSSALIGQPSARTSYVDWLKTFRSR
jgi:hypothetical protein